MIKLILSFVIAAIFLFLALHGVQWQHLNTSLVHINLYWILIAVVYQMLGILLRGIRWGIQLKADGFKNYWRVCECSIAGAMLNLILPARGGDIAKVGLAKKYLGLPASFLASTVLIEMIIDTGVAANLTILYSLFTSSMPRWMLNLSRCIDLVVFGLILTLIFSKHVLFRYRDKLPGSGTLMNKVTSLMYDVLTNIKKGIVSLSSPWQIIKYGTVVMLLWIADICLILALTIAVTKHSIDFKAYIVLSLALALSRLLPSTPGYIGVYQFVILTILRTFGINDAESLTISIYLQLVALGSTLILGSVFWSFLKNNKSQNIKGVRHA
jgi:glycosyltransferase 2 family protein